MPDKVRIAVTVNGTAHDVLVEPRTLLLDFLRDELALTGAHAGCEQGACGACTVLVDGVPTASCAAFAFQVEGSALLTVEGLRAADGTLHPIQQAFIDHGAFQCGYCTAGMILLTKALLDHNPNPSRDEIIEWLSSNVCRCTGYAMIVEAVEDAARRIGAR